MEVKLSEEQLKRLIKEDLGVSRASLSYANLIYQKLESIVKDFLITKKSVKDTIIIDIKEISQIYQSSMDDFIDLPIEGIEIDFECRYINKTSKTPYTSGGGYFIMGGDKSGSSFIKEPSFSLPKYILEEIDSSLIAKFGLFVEVRKGYKEDMLDNVLYDLRDTIVHECNHAFEDYKRFESGAKPVNVTLSWVGGKNYNVNKEIFKVWQEFLDMVYYSEPYEINAKSQEAVRQTSIKSFDDFKNTKFWRDSITMKNFDADKFFDYLLSIIGEVNPNRTLSILNNLFKWFMNDYYKWMKVQQSEPAKYIEKSKGLLDLMKRFQPRINKAGDKLQKNYMRLYTLELEK